MSNPIVLKALMEFSYFTPPEVSQIELYFVLEKATFEIIVVSSLRICWTFVIKEKYSNIKPQIKLSVASYNCTMYWFHKDLLNLLILNAVERLEGFEEMLPEFKHLFKC